MGMRVGGWGALAKFGNLGTWGVGVYQLSQSASLTGKGSNSVSFNRSDTNQVCVYPISSARNTILPKSEAKQKSLPTVLGCEVVRIATSLLPDTRYPHGSDSDFPTHPSVSPDHSRPIVPARQTVRQNLCPWISQCADFHASMSPGVRPPAPAHLARTTGTRLCDASVRDHRGYEGSHYPGIGIPRRAFSHSNHSFIGMKWGSQT